MRLIVRIGRTLGVPLTAKDILEAFPSALTYSRERLLQRYVMARLGLWNWNWTALLTLRNDLAKKNSLPTSRSIRTGMDCTPP